jgi:hypothetical protein
MAEKKEERALETVLNSISKNHISLQDDDMKRNGEHFRKVRACSEALFFIYEYIVTNTKVGLETVLNSISKNHISLQDDDIGKKRRALQEGTCMF